MDSSSCNDFVFGDVSTSTFTPTTSDFVKESKTTFDTLLTEDTNDDGIITIEIFEYNAESRTEGLRGDIILSVITGILISIFVCKF